MNQTELLAKIAKLEAENNKLSQKGNSIKVSPKGCVSVYGLGRFPVTLYAGQWDKLFAKVDEIKQFIATNQAKLAVK